MINTDAPQPISRVTPDLDFQEETQPDGSQYGGDHCETETCIFQEEKGNQGDQSHDHEYERAYLAVNKFYFTLFLFPDIR